MLTEHRPQLAGLQLFQFNSPNVLPAFIFIIIWAESFKFCVCSPLCPAHLATAYVVESSHVQKRWTRSWCGTEIYHWFGPLGSCFMYNKEKRAFFDFNGPIQFLIHRSKPLWSRCSPLSFQKIASLSFIYICPLPSMINLDGLHSTEYSV